MLKTLAGPSALPKFMLHCTLYIIKNIVFASPIYSFIIETLFFDYYEFYCDHILLFCCNY